MVVTQPGIGSRDKLAESSLLFGRCSSGVLCVGAEFQVFLHPLSSASPVCLEGDPDRIFRGNNYGRENR